MYKYLDIVTKYDIDYLSIRKSGDSYEVVVVFLDDDEDTVARHIETVKEARALCKEHYPSITVQRAG